MEFSCSATALVIGCWICLRLSMENELDYYLSLSKILVDFKISCISTRKIILAQVLPANNSMYRGLTNPSFDCDIRTEMADTNPVKFFFILIRQIPQPNLNC